MNDATLISSLMSRTWAFRSVSVGVGDAILMVSGENVKCQFEDSTRKFVEQQFYWADVQVQLIHVMLTEITDLQVSVWKDKDRSKRQTYRQRGSSVFSARASEAHLWAYLLPLTGVSSPISSFSAVDLPAPFSPTYSQTHTSNGWAPTVSYDTWVQGL